jgi:hypothetical protein
MCSDSRCAECLKERSDATGINEKEMKLKKTEENI